MDDFGTGKAMAGSHRRFAPSALVNADRPNDAIRQFNALRRMARQNDAIQKAARSVRREFPTHTRTINRQNQVYYSKWHYMKYCTQVIKYSLRRGLRLRDEIEDEASVTQKPVFENIEPSSFGSGRFSERQYHKLQDSYKAEQKRQDQQVAKETAFSEDELRNFLRQKRSSSGEIGRAHV